MSNQKYYAGIDLGGTFIKCGIADEEGTILIKDMIPTGKERPYPEVAADMANMVKDLEARAGVTVAGVGVGVPGVIDSARGVIVYSCNFDWRMVPLGETLQSLIEAPVFLTNDANIAALGECYAGAGKKYKDQVFITLGTGVGSGIILDGKLVEGGSSAGAEIGHMSIRSKGEPCPCGRRGCFEVYASATALIRQTKKAMEKDASSTLWEICNGDLNQVCGKTVFDGVALGDKTAKRVLKTYIEYLSEGLLNIANIFRPQIILLGGGISGAGDVLLKPVQRKVKRFVYGGSKYAPVRVEIATLGNDAGMLGGIYLAKTKLQ